MQHYMTRREYLATTAATSIGIGMGADTMTSLAADKTSEPIFKISVAEYSLHRMIQAGKLDPLDFGPFCRREFDVDAVEYWMGPYKDKVNDQAYMAEMHRRSQDAGVRGLLIMVDGEGSMGDPDAKKRSQAVSNHMRWVEAAKSMGCHSIRVNAHSEGSQQEQAKLVADGLRQLCEKAAEFEMNVLVENHGGLSSDGAWLARVIRRVNLANCGTLPDFGNFVTGKDSEGKDVWYDRYQGVAQLMPFAKAVSAKSHEFDAEGNETGTDYQRMLQIVVDAGYRGYVGIEWEGKSPSEVEGTQLTKQLLERVRDGLSV